jgi:hypothetical protein
MGPVDDEPPFVDEHVVDVAARPEAVWHALGASLAGHSLPQRLVAALVGTVPRRGHGDPLIEGSALPGFTVRAADPGRRLVLAGRHRFSSYTLTFVLEEDGNGTRLGACTHAAFPGLAGTAYRAAVIGSGAHRILVRRWLRQIARAAERVGS